MKVIAALVAAAMFAVVVRVPLQKRPSVFYVLAVFVDVVFFAGNVWDAPAVVWRVFAAWQARCLFGFALLAVVMFVGVLRPESRVRRFLQPVRGELSVLASLLVVGHVVNYLGVYVSRILSLRVGDAAMVVSFAVAALATLLLLPLAITSLRWVKARMGAVPWKRLQRLSYVFWGLVFAHVVLVLGGPALCGAEGACVSLAVYVAVFGAYAILRIRRYALDSIESEAECGKASSGKTPAV